MLAIEDMKTDIKEPTILTLEQYGTEAKVTLDHSDTDLDELMRVFKGMLVVHGYFEESLARWAAEYLEGQGWQVIPPPEDEKE